MSNTVKRRVGLIQRQDIFERVPKNRFSRHRRVNLRNGRVWNLSVEEYSALVVLPCVFCKEIKFETGVGLDRLDNSKGYFLGNVQPCCFICNVMKGLFPSEIFLHQAAKITRGIKCLEKKNPKNPKKSK